MPNRKLATPGALLMFAGAFLLYWGLREFGIVGKASQNIPSVAPSSGNSVASPGGMA